MTSREPVLLDTNVASFLLLDRPELLAYERDLTGRRLLLPFQVVAELIAGADRRRWGGRRRAALTRLINDHRIVYPEPGTLRVWGHLRAALMERGQETETGDLWVAALAIAEDLTLVSHDAEFRRIEGLRLICRAPGARWATPPQGGENAGPIALGASAPWTSWSCPPCQDAGSPPPSSGRTGRSRSKRDRAFEGCGVRAGGPSRRRRVGAAAE